MYEILECRADSFVDEPAAFHQHRVVGDFLGKRVLEGVFDVAQSRLLVDELAELKVIEHPVEFFLRVRTHRTNQRQRKFAPDYGQRLQQILRIGGNRSMRAARISCTVGGIFNSLIGLVRCVVAITHQRAFIEEHLHRLFHEERIALGLLDDHALERREFGAIAEQCGEHLVGGFLTQRIEAQLRVVGLAVPLMRILGTIIHQHQDLRGADGVGEEIQERLGLLIDPVQVFEDHHQRLVERFAQQDALDGVEGAPLLDLPVHLRERVILCAGRYLRVDRGCSQCEGRLGNSEQRENIGPRIFQRRIQHGESSRDLLAPRRSSSSELILK